MQLLHNATANTICCHFVFGILAYQTATKTYSFVFVDDQKNNAKKLHTVFIAIIWDIFAQNFGISTWHWHLASCGIFHCALSLKQPTLCTLWWKCCTRFNNKLSSNWRYHTCHWNVKFFCGHMEQFWPDTESMFWIKWRQWLTTVMLTASSNCCMNMLTHADASSNRISGSLN